MQIHIDDDIFREFDYMLKLHKRSGKPVLADTAEDLIRYALLTIANGSKRPDSWEREVTKRLGLIADHDTHDSYRGPSGRFGY